MSISLGTLSFGVEADTSKLDKDLNKSEKKISRFSILGVQRFNSLSSFNISGGLKKLDSLNAKLQKTQRESQKTIVEIKEIENQMNKIKTKVADTSGLNIAYDKSQDTGNRMTTTQYQAKLDELALEDKEYQKLLNKQIKLTEKSEEQALAIGRVKEQMTGLNSQIKKASAEQGLNTTFKNVKTNLKSIMSSLGKTIKNTIKWGVVLLGTGGAIRAIISGISSYLDYNKQLKADIDYMKFAIGQALGPAIQWVINLLRNLLGIVGAIGQVFFGVNLFANSFSNYMKNASSDSKKTAKNTKKISNNLADFDEIHNIQKNDDTGNDSSGTSLTAPTFNADSMIDKWIPKIKKVKAIFDEWKWAILGVAAALVALKIASVFGASLSILAGIVAIFVGLGFIIQGIIDIVNGDLIAGWGKLLIGLSILGFGVLLIFGAIPALVVVIVGIIIGLIVTIVKYGEQIKIGINNFFTWLDKLINVDMTKLFGPIIGGILNSFLSTIRMILDGIRLVFVGLVDFIQGIFTGNWQQALNGLVSILKGVAQIMLNLLISPFKTVLAKFKGIIDTIKDLWSKLWNGLKLPKIKMPHITVTYDYSGFKAEAAKLVGLPGWPKFGVDWYKKGGVFGGDSVIGVAEYTNARSNPEVVAPQSIIYDTVKRANQDINRISSANNSSEVINFTNEIKLNSKILAKEIIQDLNYEAKRLGYKPLLQKG